MSSFKEKISALLARLPLWALAVLGALLLWAAWPVRGFAGLLFINWLPLLLIEARTAAPDPATGQYPRFARWAYLFLVLWNAFTTWWVSLATIWGGSAAVVLNAGLMLLPLLAFRRTKRALGPALGYASLVVYWVAFEQIHLNWDLTWPWLTLGNGFASTPTWVQWYEYTGQLGGSAWVLTVNVLLFWALRNPPISDAASAVTTKRRLVATRFAPAGLTLLLPLLWSAYLLARFEEKGAAAEVIVVQPNVDPYNEKFPSNIAFIPYETQIQRLIQLSDSLLTPQTRFVLWPETSLEQGADEVDLPADWRIQRTRAWLARHPGVQLITGITTLTRYDRPDASPTVREHNGVYYDVFNTALHVPGPVAPLAVYHKSKLVPGVERLPYPSIFGILKVFAIDLGGTVGSYGTQPERGVFAYDASAANPKVGPVICYESIYSDFVAGYVRRGATLIGIITNDGWWANTPGHRQHLAYAALRAIETRRDVVRAANTGISAFLDQRGRITQTLGWWRRGALRGTVHLNTEQTFYVRHGDYLGYLMPAFALGLLAMMVVAPRVRRPKAGATT
ncbi:MAG: apolipoprotein N-acyltransferase [Hymenobacteraceae bacterium]|nr:apolipoprotein N-acyltransferase [Hymenobacteraceae bacterium]